MADAAVPETAPHAERKWTPARVRSFRDAIKIAAYKKKKELATLKKAAELAQATAKTTARNRTYVMKMLSLPKLIFTEQVAAA
jgi:hypothetical protein